MRYTHDTEKERWIHGLLTAGVQPALVLLEKDIPLSHCNMREQEWIRIALAKQFPITNVVPVPTVSEALVTKR